MKKNKILDLEKREFLVVISFCCMVMKLIELLEFSTNVHDIVLTKSIHEQREEKSHDISPRNDLFR